MRVSASPLYYGWFVLAASSVSELLVMGATAYAAGLFVLPLQAEFHISRANASSAILLLYVGAAFAAPLVGRLLDRFSIRLVMCLAAMLFGLSFAAIALAPSLWIMALILLVPAAAGFAALGPLTTQTLTARWFYRHRGLALGIAAVATSGGGFVVVPLLSKAILAYGWRQGLLFEALAVSAVIIVLALTVLRDSPFAQGLGEHAENRGRAQTQAASGPPLAWKAIFTSRDFWIPSLALAIISGTSQAAVTTLVPYGIQLGYAPASVAFLVSAFAIAAGVTKVGAGILADRISQRLLLVAAALCMTLSWLALTLSAAYGALFAGAALAGIALGCVLPTAAGLIAARFGSARFGAVMGWTYALILILAIVSVRFAGFVYDRFGGYHAAFLAFTLILAGLLAAMLVFAPQPRRADA